MMSINGEFIYKGYKGSFEYSENDSIYFGKILDIKDLVSYEGKTLALLEQLFQETVDEYISELKK